MHVCADLNWSASPCSDVTDESVNCCPDVNGEPGDVFADVTTIFELSFRDVIDASADSCDDVTIELADCCGEPDVTDNFGHTVSFCAVITDDSMVLCGDVTSDSMGICCDSTDASFSTCFDNTGDALTSAFDAGSFSFVRTDCGVDVTGRALMFNNARPD